MKPERSRRPIFWFFIKLGAIYGLLIAPWPGLDTAYRAVFRAIHRPLFCDFGSNGTVTFKPEPDPADGWNSHLILTNTKSGTRMQITYRSRHAYLACALTVALVLATPLPWTRRWKSLLIALLLIHLFLAVRLGLGLLDAFSEERMGVLSFTPNLKRALQLCVVMLLVSPETTFVVPVFVWIVATFRRGDFQRLGIAGGLADVKMNHENAVLSTARKKRNDFRTPKRQV